MLEIEPWQLFPLPPEQVGKIRSYIERRERQVEERALLGLLVYVVIVNDRHDDPQPHLFSTPDAALEFARTEALRLARTEEHIDEEAVDGWLYSAQCGNEGDSVWVIEKELDGDGRG
jgi:hypothetical protein